MKTIAAVVRESVASAIAGPAASILTVLMIAGMVITVVLTTGRTVGAEEQVLSSIDSVGTRSITVRAETGAGVTSDVMNRVEGIEGVQWAAALSSAVDATNTAVPDGTRVPVRYAYGPHLEELGIPTPIPLSAGMAYASERALTLLGLPDVAGAVTLTNGLDYAVAGQLEIPDFLSSFEPVVVVPRPEADGDESVNVMVIIAARPDLVAPVSDAVLSVLAAEDPSKITVETSEVLAELRTLVQGQLGTFSRGLVLIILAVTGLLVATILFGLVTMRRKDFGRRRALGATRSLIVGLLLTQTLILAIAGVAGGSAAATIVLLASRDPIPSAGFFASVGALALGTAATAALVPAVVASRREPIRELRVP